MAVNNSIFPSRLPVTSQWYTSDEFTPADDLSSSGASGWNETEDVDVLWGKADVLWGKAASGVWGLGHVFTDKLYFAKDFVDDSFVPKDEQPRPIPTR